VCESFAQWGQNKKKRGGCLGGGSHLVLGGVTDETLRVGERNERRGGSVTLVCKGRKRVLAREHMNKPVENGEEDSGCAGASGGDHHHHEVMWEEGWTDREGKQTVKQNRRSTI
jgi:hypothetical protein